MCILLKNIFSPRGEKKKNHRRLKEKKKWILDGSDFLMSINVCAIVVSEALTLARCF